jgi:hypothetical protein
MPSSPTIATNGTLRRISCEPVASIQSTTTLSRQETTGARSSAVGPSPNAGGLWLLGAAAAKLGWGGGAPSPPLSSGMNEECIDGRAIDRHYCQRASTSFAARLSRVY